ncbi:MAG: hypothetical protein CL678_05240 [Bdellovibrionaceae bacterium]|nr:hypothetical protein [Pseudobdellovibrionaceae bacterium]
MKFRKTFQWFLLGITTLFGVAVGATLTLLITAGMIYDTGDTYHPGQKPQVDVIVCLAGARGRIAKAAEIWEAYYLEAPDKPPLLYISGMGPQADWSVFEKQIPPWIQSHLTQEWVILENQSTNTVENAQWLLKYAAQWSWKDLLLVTSSYHLRRSLYVFHHILKPNGDFKIHTYSVTEEPFSANSWYKSGYGIRVTLLEHLKWIYFRTVWNSGFF